MWPIVFIQTDLEKLHDLDTDMVQQVLMMTKKKKKKLTILCMIIRNYCFAII